MGVSLQDYFVPNLSTPDVGLEYFDHHWVICDFMMTKPKPSPQVITYRKLKYINIKAFCSDISESVIGNPEDTDSFNAQAQEDPRIKSTKNCQCENTTHF